VPKSRPQLPGHIQVESDDSREPRFQPARDRLRNCMVAVKRSRTRTQTRALRHEWMLLHRLSGSYTPAPLDFFVQDESEGFVTTAWVEGLRFEQFWSSASPRHRLEALWSALAGLNHIHRAGYRHGDVRPDNLILSPHSRGVQATWIDLEHAQRLGSLRAGGEIVSGWNPELFGRGADPDLRALGNMLQSALPANDGGGDSAIVTEFTLRLCDDYHLAEMPHAWAAMHLLAHLSREGGNQSFVPTFLSDQPAPVINLAAKNQWAEIQCDIGLEGSHSLIQVSGRPHTGKTTFLRCAAMEMALDSRFRVLNLLYPAPMLTAESVRYVADWVAEQKSPAALFLAADLWEKVKPDVVRTASASLLVVTEVPGHPAVSVDASGGWDVIRWEFPPFSSREWYRWISKAI
jgi:hypothetical protein